MLGSVAWAVDTAAVGPAAALVGLAQRPTHHLLDRRHVLHQLAAAFAQGGGGKVLENHRIASKGCPRESEVESSVNPFVTALQASHQFSELNQAKRVDKQRLAPGRRRSARRRPVRPIAQHGELPRSGSRRLTDSRRTFNTSNVWPRRRWNGWVTVAEPKERLASSAVRWVCGRTQNTHAPGL